MFLEWKLMFIRRKQQKKLNPYNLTVFKNIITYIKHSSLASLEMEEVLHQVLDMMLQAQQENKNINLFLGKDHQSLCDAIISEYDSARSKTLKVVSYIEFYLVTLLSMLITNAILERAHFFTLNVVTLAIFFCFIIDITSRSTNKDKTYPTNKTKGSGCGTFIMFFIIYMTIMFILDKILKSYGFDIFETQISLFSVRYPLALAVLFVIGTEVYKAFSRRRKKHHQ